MATKLPIERYEIQDGWATPGKAQLNAAPTFEIAKINVPSMAASTSLRMIYFETS